MTKIHAAVVFGVFFVSSVLSFTRPAFGRYQTSHRDTATIFLEKIQRAFYAPADEAFLDSFARENKRQHPDLPTPYENDRLYETLMQCSKPILETVALIPNANRAPLALGTIQRGLLAAYMFPVPNSAQGVIAVDGDVFAYMVAMTQLALRTVEVSSSETILGRAMRMSFSDSLSLVKIQGDTTLVQDLCDLLNYLLLEPVEHPDIPIDTQSVETLLELFEAQGRFVIAHEVAHHIFRHRPRGMRSPPGLATEDIKAAVYSWGDEMLADLMGERLLLLSLVTDSTGWVLFPDGEKALLVLQMCAPLLLFATYDILEEAEYVVRHDTLPPAMDAEAVNLMANAAVGLMLRDWAVAGHPIDESMLEISSIDVIDSLITLIPEVLLERSHPPFALRRGYYLQTLDLLEIGMELPLSEAFGLQNEVPQSDTILLQARLCGRLSLNLMRLWRMAYPEFRERVRAMRERGKRPWIELR